MKTAKELIEEFESFVKKQVIACESSLNELDPGVDDFDIDRIRLRIEHLTLCLDKVKQLENKAA